MHAYNAQHTLGAALSAADAPRCRQAPRLPARGATPSQRCSPATPRCARCRCSGRARTTPPSLPSPPPLPPTPPSPPSPSATPAASPPSTARTPRVPSSPTRRRSSAGLNYLTSRCPPRPRRSASPPPCGVTRAQRSSVSRTSRSNTALAVRMQQGRRRRSQGTMRRTWRGRRRGLRRCWALRCARGGRRCVRWSCRSCM